MTDDAQKPVAFDPGVAGLNVMLDLETLGTRPGSVILSIGMSLFGPEGLAPSGFYMAVNRQSCLQAGLTEDDATLDWWSKQSGDAKRVIDDAETKERSIPIGMALNAVDFWLNQALEMHGWGGQKDRLRVWGNGAAFDNALLAEAAIRCGRGGPLWGHRSDRCYRTLRATNLNIPAPPGGPLVAHHAMHDAAYQAAHAVAILNSNLAWN